MSSKVILEMKNISKSFPGVKALENVSIAIKQGTTHALMGENGAGKSTLMKILVGLYSKDEGEITFLDKRIDDCSISSILEQGISMIYQELCPIDDMTVMENIYVGREPYKIKWFMIDKKKMLQDTIKLFEDLNISNISPTEKVRNLSIAQKQMLEIAKAVSYNSKIIIMDEPTSAITEQECQHLFQIVNELKKTGLSFIFITHKMNEVFVISDEVTVLRDGQLIATEKVENMTEEKLIKMMIGRELSNMFPKEKTKIGDVVLSVNGLTAKGLFENVSFYLRKGEILGFAGLMGSGRTEVMETLFGYRKADAGEVFLKGKKINIKSPVDSISYKMAFLTEDRKETGCFLPLNITDNLMTLNWHKHKRFLKLKKKSIKKVCNEEIKRFDIKTTGTKQIMNDLSGGNQQKVLVSRWLLSDPEILILDEPTRGIDVGTKAEIHKIISNLVKKGKAIVLISSELPEILSMSDRIIVMHEGKVTGIIDREEASQEKIMQYAIGI